MLSSGVARMAYWRRLVESAIVEREASKVERLANDAEAAMWRRTQELPESSDGHYERHEIEKTYGTLQTLRTEILGWHDAPIKGKTQPC